ncbi:MAG: hypothetical protein EPN60_15145 [Nevskiaceae bacterium]|nr:MAG: hypothetical protein EPN60_15145 [Nevskiaceae bacterium]
MIAASYRRSRCRPAARASWSPTCADSSRRRRQHERRPQRSDWLACRRQIRSQGQSRRGRALPCVRNTTSARASAARSSRRLERPALRSCWTMT